MATAGEFSEISPRFLDEIYDNSLEKLAADEVDTLFSGAATRLDAMFSSVETQHDWLPRRTGGSDAPEVSYGLTDAGVLWADCAGGVWYRLDPAGDNLWHLVMPF